MRDLKQALRMFRENRTFTATVVLTLMLGIGANTAVFSVINAVVLKGVPFLEPDRLVQLVLTDNGAPTWFVRSPAAYMHAREQTDVLEDVAAYRDISFNYAGPETSERIAASQVTATYFGAFRAPLELGRAFTEDEDSPGASETAVISHDFWTQRFGGDPEVLGKTLTLNGLAYTIVGVMAPEFDTREFGRIDLWVPAQLDPATSDQGSYYYLVARLRSGVSLAQAQARLDASAATYRERFPAALSPNTSFSAVRFQDAVVGAGTVNDVLGNSTRTLLWTLLGAVGFVLLIACANVASLMLMRASGRSSEIAIRSAVGAQRWRIIRQLLTEGAVLCAVGAALGLVLGFLGMRALLAMDTAGLPRLEESGMLISLDWRVVGFTVVLSMVSCLLFSLVPALLASRTDLTSVLTHASGRAGSGFRQGKIASILVVMEVGVAVVLLIGTALLIRTSLALERVDPGFNRDDVIVMQTDLTEPRFASLAAMEEVSSRTLDTVRAIPGVAAATGTCCVPLHSGYGMVFNITGREHERPFTGGGDFSMFTGEYFATLEIPVLRGRVFDERDHSNSPPVIVINRTLAERFWPEDENPVGDRILIGGGGALFPELADEPIREIIGIVDNVRAVSLSGAPRPAMYVPLSQYWRPADQDENTLEWVVRTSLDPMQLSARIQDEIRQATGVPVTDVQPMTRIVSDSVSRQRINMVLMTVFGGSALLLASIGLYGVIAYSVQQRYQEIGIRMALGAHPRRIRNMIVRQGMLLIAIGTAIGLVAALFLGDLLASVLFGVEPRDLMVFVGIPVILTLVALAAVSVPARRASRVNSLTALRYE